LLLSQSQFEAVIPKSSTINRSHLLLLLLILFLLLLLCVCVCVCVCVYFSKPMEKESPNPKSL
ncbi:hypothetical protein ACOSB0_00355, partial [Candidatus Phytoplasma citri]